MKEMTDHEAEYLDEYYTENTIMPDMRKPGYFTCKYGMTITLDSEITQMLSVYAEKIHKTPAEAVSELIRKELVLTPV